MGGFSGVVGTEAPLEWGEGQMGEDVGAASVSDF